MAIVFDGKLFAQRKESFLREYVADLRKRGITPTLASILVGGESASILYVNLKKKAAQRIGAQVEIYKYKDTISYGELTDEIKTLNKEKNVHGIMIQLPLPSEFSKKKRDEIINTIDPKKDVDGLRENSPYLTPTVKAVLEVIKEATPYVTQEDRILKLVIVGARGFEGAKIFKVLKEMDYDVVGLDKSSKHFRETIREGDLIISVTGSPGIIGKEEVKEGAVIIDVGSPKGDVKTQEVLGKASFISPVPGGIGPVTISSLLENLIDSAG